MVIESLLMYAREKWHLSQIRKIKRPQSVINYVVIAHSAIYNIDVILKILGDATHEIEALSYFEGQGIVALLDYDKERGLILLPFIRPGIHLKTLFPAHDDEATRIFAAVVEDVHKACAKKSLFQFDTVEKWLILLSSYQSYTIAKTMLDEAYKKALLLLQNRDDYIVLHGDLHHENIIKKENTWIAIDPKGVRGPFIYELARYCMNPIPDLLQQKYPEKIVLKRTILLSTIFSVSPRELQDWIYIQALLSAIWAEQDGQEFFLDYFLRYALFLKQLF